MDKNFPGDDAIMRALNLGTFTERQLKDDEHVLVSWGTLKRAFARYGQPAQPAAGAEPVATLHDDGHYTFHGDKPHDYNYAGWNMKVYATPQPQQIPENIKQAIQKAYGHLWMVNNEPGTPNQYPPEHAIYKARQLLLGILTKEERGDGINSAMLEAAPEVKP